MENTLNKVLQFRAGSNFDTSDVELECPSMGPARLGPDAAKAVLKRFEIWYPESEPPNLAFGWLGRDALKAVLEHADLKSNIVDAFGTIYKDVAILQRSRSLSWKDQFKVFSVNEAASNYSTQIVRSHINSLPNISENWKKDLFKFPIDTDSEFSAPTHSNVFTLGYSVTTEHILNKPKRECIQFSPSCGYPQVYSNEIIPDYGEGDYARSQCEPLMNWDDILVALNESISQLKEIKKAIRRLKNEIWYLFKKVTSTIYKSDYQIFPIKRSLFNYLDKIFNIEKLFWLFDFNNINNSKSLSNVKKIYSGDH